LQNARVQIPYAAEQGNKSDEQGDKIDDQGIKSAEDGKARQGSAGRCGRRPLGCSRRAFSIMPTCGDVALTALGIIFCTAVGVLHRQGRLEIAVSEIRDSGAAALLES
jgi:hypothetical protein